MAIVASRADNEAVLWLIGVGLVFLLAIVFATKQRAQRTDTEEAPGLTSQEAVRNGSSKESSFVLAALTTTGYLLSLTELKFYKQAILALPEHLMLCPKVRLEDIIQCPTRDWATRNRIKSRHVDFVLAERTNLRIHAVVELDDHTHKYQRRRERDEMVDRALESAGIPMIRVDVAPTYDMGQLAELFRALTRRAA